MKIIFVVLILLGLLGLFLIHIYVGKNTSKGVWKVITIMPPVHMSDAELWGGGGAGGGSGIYDVPNQKQISGGVGTYYSAPEGQSGTHE